MLENINLFKHNNIKLYRALVIYIYLLFIITIILHHYPGLIDYNQNNLRANQQNNYQKFISGGYLSDTVKFPIDSMYFPVAVDGYIGDSLYYYDTYGGERTYGGNRNHEGCDIMTRNNIRGEYPIVSICDGVVEKIGWLELGGYRIGVMSETGVYYYYAHLYRYDNNITEGTKIHAGQVLGYVGDTGYSKVEGTTGNFDVHLHFGIYLTDEYGNEYTVNPYPMLKELEKHVINYSFQN